MGTFHRIVIGLALIEMLFLGGVDANTMNMTYGNNSSDITVSSAGTTTLTVDSNNRIKNFELKEINADRILWKINNGEDIHLTNHRITGELNLSKLNNSELKTEFIINPMILYDEFEDKEHKIVTSRITIENSIFENDVDLSYTKFTKPVSFSGSRFSKKTNFKSVVFYSPVIFTKAIFNDSVVFSFGTFNGQADFDSVHFYGFAHFNRLKFESFVSFSNSIFFDKVKFNGTEFNGFFSLLKNVTFKKDAMFELARFSDVAYFDQAIFDELSSFHQTKFKTVSFNDTRFKNVDFNEADFDRIRFTNWSSIENTLNFNGPNVYLRLIKNFNDMGQYEDADDAYNQYRKISQTNKKGISWGLDELSRVIIGYGVEPFNSILVGLVLIFIFLLIYSLIGMPISKAFECSVIAFISGYNPDFISNEFKSPISCFVRRLLKNDWIAKFYMNLKNLPNINLVVKFYTNLKSMLGILTQKRLIKVLMVLESLCGWFILALFIVSLANIMIR